MSMQFIYCILHVSEITPDDSEIVLLLRTGYDPWGYSSTKYADLRLVVPEVSFGFGGGLLLSQTCSRSVRSKWN